jgi:hypothetical protein
MAKKQSADGLISPANLWGKPLPTSKQPPAKKSTEKVTGKMTDPDDVMEDEEIDVDAELTDADVEDEELEKVTAEDDSEVSDDVDGDDEEDEAEDEEPEYEDDDVEDESQDVVEDEAEVVTAVADDDEETGDEAVSDTTEDVPVMAEKMSLSDHVRAEIARRQKSGESLRGKDILETLSKRKIKVSAAQISQLLKKAGLSGKTRGRPAAAPAVAGAEKGRAALKAKKRDVTPATAPAAPPRQTLKARPVTGNGFKVPMSQLEAAEAFVEACGGSFKAANQILTAAEQLSQTFGN